MVRMRSRSSAACPALIQGHAPGGHDPGRHAGGRRRGAHHVSGPRSACPPCWPLAGRRGARACQPASQLLLHRCCRRCRRRCPAARHGAARPRDRPSILNAAGREARGEETGGHRPACVNAILAWLRRSWLLAAELSPSCEWLQHQPLLRPPSPRRRARAVAGERCRRRPHASSHGRADGQRPGRHVAGGAGGRRHGRRGCGLGGAGARTCSKGAASAGVHPRMHTS